jgi:predicted transcriptional regulator
MNFNDITAAAVRDEGITIVSLARRTGIPSSRLYWALSGYGTSWLTPDEQQRLRTALDHHGLLTQEAN